MQESNLLEADQIVRSLRDTLAEDNLLDTVIDLMAGVAECLHEVRSLGG